MEQNDRNVDLAVQTEKNTETSEQAAACGCGNGTNKVVVAIWVVLLVGFISVVMFTRSGSNSFYRDAKLIEKASDYFDRQEFEKAAQCLREAAEHGYPQAQLYYGGCLKKGIGVEQDLPAAVEWFRKSAAQEFPVAFYELAVCCENGEGMAPNPDEAIEWYQKALEGGIEEAREALERVAKLKEESTPEARALALYNQALELFDQQGRDVECAGLLRQSAELGYVWAQLFYGRFLCKGIGTALDPAEAVEWFRKAADQDCPGAFYELGVCYENGDGVGRDLDAALEWYRKALAADFTGAQNAITRVEKAKALSEKDKTAAPPSN